MSTVTHEQLESMQAYYENGLLRDYALHEIEGSSPRFYPCDVCSDDVWGEFSEDDLVLCNPCKENIPELIELGIISA